MVRDALRGRLLPGELASRLGVSVDELVRREPAAERLPDDRVVEPVPAAEALEEPGLAGFVQDRLRGCDLDAGEGRDLLCAEAVLKHREQRDQVAEHRLEPVEPPLDQLLQRRGNRDLAGRVDGGGQLPDEERAPDPVTPPPPGGGAAPDTTAPRITAARLTRKRFAVGRRPTPLIAARRGTKVRLTLSERASLVLRVERQRPGRRVGGRCRPVTRRNAARRKCRRFVLAGTLRRADVAQQASIAFSGRLGRKALRRGPHRFSIVAVDAAGNRSARVRLAFRVLRG